MVRSNSQKIWEVLSMTRALGCITIPLLVATLTLSSSCMAMPRQVSGSVLKEADSGLSALQKHDSDAESMQSISWRCVSLATTLLAVQTVANAVCTLVFSLCF